MGACYSKSNTGAKTSADSKGSKFKFRLLEHNKKGNVEELSLEKVPLKDSETGLANTTDSPVTKISRCSTADLVSDHANLKQVDHTIVPSDSGIESIGTAQDEAQASARLKQGKDELLNHLEHQNLQVCQSCGHLKVNDCSLLTNSNILWNSKLTIKSIVEPKWNSHNLESKESASTSAKTRCDQDLKVFTGSNKNATVKTGNKIKGCGLKDRDNSELRPSLDESNSAKENAGCVSVQTSSCRYLIHISKSEDKSKNSLSEAMIEEKGRIKAPLVTFDSLDTNLNDDMVIKQQSLLTDFQDITDSLCYCDSYSKHGNGGKYSEGNQVVTKAEYGVDRQSLDEEEQSYHSVITEQESQPLLNQSSINHCNHSKALEKSISPLSLSSREISSSLPKIVSFAHHKEARSLTVTKSASPSRTTPIPISREVHVNHCDSSVSDSSSGIYTHQTVSRSLFSNGQKVLTDENQRSVSLGSVDGMTSESSSDLLVNGTEDDMTSLDLDNISRLTFHSTTSIRQLNGSAEEVSSSLRIAQATTVDGMDCVIIPKETYHQMQTELSVLKQQLICLSSLIQESEEQEQNADCEAHTQT